MGGGREGNKLSEPGTQTCSNYTSVFVYVCVCVCVYVCMCVCACVCLSFYAVLFSLKHVVFLER